MRRWPYTLIVIVSVVIGLTALVASQQQGVPLKDPEGFLGPAYVRLPLMGLAFFAAGIVPQALHRYGVKRFGYGLREIVRTEWTLRRVGYIATGLLAFYTCYVSYRNLKSYLPIFRDRLWDRELQYFDHWLFFGNYPATVLHDILGTGIAAHVLAFIYVSYLMLIPITLAAFLVLNKDLTIGAWYSTALGLNWVLGTLSYYMIYTQGPGFFMPQLFREVDESGATTLMHSLFRAGSAFREDTAAQAIYGIAGFASLHTSVVFTACLFFGRVGLHRIIRIIAWLYFTGTVLATIYFGWHFTIDVVGGVIIGWAAVALGAWATKNTKRERRERENAASSTDQPTAGGDDSNDDTVANTA